MKPKKILLIENDQMTIDFYREVFKIFDKKFELEVLMWGFQALNYLKEIREGKRKKPELILLDLILDDIDGIDILKEARKYPETKELKIFALTNYTDPKLNQELIKEGIDKIIVKVDYKPKELIDLIEESLTKQE